MSQNSERPDASLETANDRFKRGSGERFWGSLIVATMLHFAVLAFWPAMNTAVARDGRPPIVHIVPPPPIDLPEAPELLARPAAPVVSQTELDPAITMPLTTLPAHAPQLPSLPSRAGPPGDGPVFTPMTVAPELRNRAAVQRALVRNYPPLLRDAGIGGTPTVWFYVDENGRVLRTLLNQSSGHDELDQAALRVAGMMEFSPAWHHQEKVAVWVSIPIVFQAR